MIGPDSAVPAFVFERWRDDPRISWASSMAALSRQMMSTYPPITVLSQVAAMASQVAAL